MTKHTPFLLLLAIACGSKEPTDDSGTPTDSADSVADCEAQTWYADQDGDGHGDPAASVESCEAPEGYLPDADDCDDADPSVCPGCVEVCDSKDNDCDGGVDLSAEPLGFSDLDGDGYGDADNPSYDLCGGWIADDSDCDDSDSAVSPAASEACATGQDEDCDGLVDCDDDDCAADAACLPEAVCDDGLDDDSDGLIDCEDGDCASDVVCLPEAVCDDGLDDDSDGLIDCDDDDCWASCSAGTMTVQVTYVSGNFTMDRSYNNSNWRWESSMGGRYGGHRGFDYHRAIFNEVQGIAVLRTSAGASSVCAWEVDRFHFRQGQRSQSSTLNGGVTYAQTTTVDLIERDSFAWSSACGWNGVGSSVLPQRFQGLTRLNSAVYLTDGRAWYAPIALRYTGGGSAGGTSSTRTDSQGVVWTGWSGFGGYSSGWTGRRGDVGSGATYTQQWP